MSSLLTQPAPASGEFAIGGYDGEISGGASAAHYVSDYDEVAGIRLPTRHRIFPRAPDGQSLSEPLIVSIDLSETRFSTAVSDHGSRRARHEKSESNVRRRRQ